MRSPRTTHMIRKLAISTLIMACTLLAGTPAFAVNEKVSVGQNPDGTIVATLSGDNSVCGFGFFGSPTVTAAGANFTVTSTIVGLGAPCPPGPVALIPYSISVNLGTVPDGSHIVTWSFVGLVMPSVSATFTIAGALLVLPPTVPALTTSGAFALMFLLLLAAYPLLAPKSKHRTAKP
jgi:hypothetical protein